MRVRLMLVVADQSRALVERCLEGFEGVQAQWVVYRDESEIERLMEEAAEDTDAFFFGGPMPLDRSQAVLPPEVPVSVARLGAIDLALCVLRARERGLAPAPVSVDTFDGAIADELCRELELPREQVFTLPHRPGITAEELVAFHHRHKDDGAAAYAITGRGAVYRALVPALGTPVFKAVPVETSVRAAIKEAVLGGISRRHASLRFGAAVFKILEQSSPYAGERNRLGLHQLLLSSPEFEEGWIEPRGDRSLIVFAHKGIMEQVTNGWSTVPMMSEIHDRLGLRVAAGFGLGESARRSVAHAERAVVRAEQDGGNCGYLMGQDGLIIGPMAADGAALRYAYKAETGRLQALAQQTGLGVTTLSRLADIDRRTAGAPISVAELSEALHISQPTGRRLVRTLRQAELTTPIGIAQPTKRGRPKPLYRLRVREALATPEERTEEGQC